MRRSVHLRPVLLLLIGLWVLQQGRVDINQREERVYAENSRV